ncbi:MAG: insulinase family protein [Burkholderiales bacterium]|nr:insulinase family protein [Burkholderiales bacterium]
MCLHRLAVGAARAVAQGIAVSVVAAGLWFSGSAAAQPSVASPSAASRALPHGITAGPSAEGISEYNLANGLKVLLFPDPSKELTLVNITYLVGSKHENYGETGMAHLLEHLVFKGTPTYADPTKEFAARGMRWNGTTNHERTNYFEAFTANDDHLRFALAFEADRMINSHIARKDLDSEMTVVRNEYERGETEPFRVLLQRLNAAAFATHNYGKPTIGARSDIENVNIERLQAFYKRYYQPDNAVLLIGGKFDPAKTLGWVAEHFGPIKRPTRVLPTLYTTEPTQDGERLVSVRRVGDIQASAVGYKVPNHRHADSDALGLLTRALTSNPSGFLHKTFVETKRAVQLATVPSGGVDIGLSNVVLVADKRADLPALEAELLNYLEGRSAAPITQAELDRVKRELAVGLDKLMESPIAVALGLSEVLPLGDWRLLFASRDRMAKVTLADVERVRKAYFKPSNRTVARFLPEAAPDRVEIPAAPSVAAVLAAYTPRAALADGEAFEPTPKALESRVVRSTSDPQFKSAVLRKQNRGDAVMVQISLRWGELREQLAQPALGLVAALVNEGASRDALQARKDALTQLKSTFNVGGGAQGATITVVSDRAHVLAALQRVLPEVRAGTFDRDAFERIKKQRLTAIEARQNEPQTVLNRQAIPYKNKAFGVTRGDPHYRLTDAEAIEELRGIRFEDVVQAWQKNWGASDVRVAVVGTAPDGVVEEVRRQLANWPSQARAFVRHVGQHQPLPGTEISAQVDDKANALLDVDQYLPLSQEAPDAVAFGLAAALFGGNGLDNRLAERMRKKDGITYAVNAQVQLPRWGDRGYFGIEGSYAPQNRDRMLAALREETTRALRDGFTEDELTRTRANALQGRKQRWNSDGAIVGALIEQMENGETFHDVAARDARYAAVTLDEVNAAFRKYIKPEQWLIGVAGDFAKAAKAAKDAKATPETAAKS